MQWLSSLHLFQRNNNSPFVSKEKRTFMRHFILSFDNPNIVNNHFRMEGVFHVDYIYHHKFINLLLCANVCSGCCE